MVHLSSNSRLAIAIFFNNRCLFGVEVWCGLVECDDGCIGQNLTIWCHLPKGLDKSGIKVLASKVGLTDPSISDELFEQKIISSGGIVVPVGFNALPSETMLKSQLDSSLQDLVIDGYAMIADY